MAAYLRQLTLVCINTIALFGFLPGRKIDCKLLKISTLMAYFIVFNKVQKTLHN
jgi:hypothetical protein